MFKIFLSIVLYLFLLSCSKNIINNNLKHGIIDYRPKIKIDKTTQINLDFSEIQCRKIDTSLHFNNDILDSLENYLVTVKQKGNYKGLSVAVGIPDEGFWKSVIGESGTESSLSTNTKFHSLSLGKIFTSALTLKLIEQGFLNINDTVKKWFPDCPRSDEITINHLLSHSSGIQTYDALYEYVLNNGENFTENDLLDIAFQYDISDPPGSFISYTNTGYTMLGLIISKVTGKSLKDNFCDYFINPLKLKNTFYCDKEVLTMNGIKGFKGDEISEKTRWPLTYAAAPFISTPTDITIIYNYLLSGRFLENTSMNLFFSEMNIWKNDPDTYYGKGIYTITGLPSGRYLGHAGGWNSFSTCIFYNIEKKISISIFSNTNAAVEPAMFFLCEKIMKLLE